MRVAELSVCWSADWEWLTAECGDPSADHVANSWMKLMVQKGTGHVGRHMPRWSLTTVKKMSGVSMFQITHF